ncbi:Subtilase family protein [Jatrophihabitans endophyticus]|uniref:Subtilase family protein n=1 Tax=Jatrophihabitans endophyticus TaxID=1206085 RepID=A0A1M5I8D6_9ACTN|nr:PKD domain-containing protein [Jatrophihabitans endophyticus]SHG24638.1 Subtilase family protein [Jatrophihabitans endophyticus]
MRTTPARVVVAAVAALLGATALSAIAPTASGAAPSAASSASSGTATRYAVVRPLCATPSDPSAMRCFALERVDVARGTAGAHAYRPTASHGPKGGYAPKALAGAYGFDPKVNRRSLTVGIVLWHDAPTVLHDLNRFDHHYGLPSETSRSFRKVNERGKASPLPKRDKDAAGEVALDTQAVRAVCNTCRILLVEADGPYDSDLANAENTAVRLGADIVTNSFGAPEHKVSTRTRKAFDHPGVAVIASTGDSGWYGWDWTNYTSARNGLVDGDDAASFPSSSPTVVAVGGTTLRLDSRNHRTSETVWNGNGAHDATGHLRRSAMGASGGGCSKYYTAPSWQAHAAGYASAGCKGRRLATDVALLADPMTGFDVYDSYGSKGWVTVGGTSLSAPLAAGMYALAGGPRGSRYPATALYGNAAAHASTRYDVKVGGNGFCGTDTTAACSSAVADYTSTSHAYANVDRRNPNNIYDNEAGLLDCSFARDGEAVPAARDRECNATTGFDGPTGVGTPRATKLFKRTDPAVAIKHSSPVRAKKSRSYRAIVREPLPRTKVTKLTWKWGDRRTTTSTKGSVHHTYKKKGTYTVTLTVRDSRHQASVVTQRVVVR